MTTANIELIFMESVDEFEKYFIDHLFKNNINHL